MMEQTVATLLIFSVVINVVTVPMLIEILNGRRRLHAQFRNVVRIDGQCQCPYCRGDADDLAELAADYELKLWRAEQRLGLIASPSSPEEPTEP